MIKNYRKYICTMTVVSMLLTGCANVNIALSGPESAGNTGDSAAVAADTSAAETAETAASDDGLGHGESGYDIQGGMAQPILQFKNFRDDDYSNENSDILRFCVYVETDHDTDNDGLADLVKVFAQVPTAAVNGDYKAAVIYDPTPYAAGTTDNYSFAPLSDYYDTGFDYNLLYKDCEKRPGADEISTMDLALTENPQEWNYAVPSTGVPGYAFYSDHYNYYLVRGYAVVECGGIGTLGSQGYELCGYDLEAEAHKCVIEWLTGSRTAYSDINAENEVRADWCNGKVAMTGCSYGGTLPYEVATLGPEGLETIIPFAGISSWYAYTNSQGVTKYYKGRYMDFLASYNSGSLFLDDDWTVINPDYAAWLSQIAADQDEANGNYTDIWRISDYSDDYENIKCSALIVHGLNDFNVSTRQSDLMYQAFKKAGQNVKLVLHQDGHNFLNGITVGDDVWQNVMNRWLSHYLLDVDNGIEDMAEVTYQSNVDGKFYTADSWRDFNYERTGAAYTSDYTSVTSEGFDDVIAAWFADSAANAGGLGSGIESEIYVNIPEQQAASYTLDLKEGETVYGVPTVHFSAAPSVSDLTGLKITAVLVDVMEDDQAFPAYMTMESLGNTLPVKTLDYFDEGASYGGSSVKEFVKSYTRAKVISYGWTDLANPGAGENPSDYSKDTDIKAGESYDYTFYMLPTIYTLEPGHSLKLILTTYDPLGESLVDDEEYIDYGYTIDNSTLDVEIPVLP